VIEQEQMLTSLVPVRQGGLVMAKSGRWNWETIFEDTIGLSSTTMT